MSRFKLTFWICLGVLVLFTEGCTRSAVAPRDRLRIAIWAEPASLNPNSLTNWESRWVNSLISQPLGAAQQSQHLEKGPILIVNLRDAKWNDGVPVTADHFIAGWAAARAERAPTSDPSPVPEAQLKAKSPTILEISGVTDLSSLSELTPLRADIKKSHPANFAVPPHHRSNGPYRLQDWKRGETVTLELNPYYPRNPKGFRWIEFHLVHDLETAVAKYREGQIDLIPLPANLVDSEKKLLRGAGIEENLSQATAIKFAVHPRLKIPHWNAQWPLLESATLSEG